MPLPLFTVEPQEFVKASATVNLLPCRINHDGEVNPSDTFWNPSQAEDGQRTAYFRGRKLRGKHVKLPEGYYGSVVEKGDPKPETSHKEMTEDVEVIENPADQLEVGIMNGKATFDELIVWGHESINDSSADPYIRGMEEWVTFSSEV
ncbi:ribonuclease H1 small subunit [Xylariaceae sp. FL0255]|nr:ribonuclease H1 small subunit [Xylariaceae sp. FL0255]